jgi:hypothetical protein
LSHFSNAIGQSGPVLICFVGLSLPREQALVAAGQTPPPAQIANLLIDTGASHTVIDQKFVSLLNLVPTGSIMMHTPSTGTVPHPVQTYDIALAFAGIGGAVHSLVAHSVSACDFSGQAIDGLLGRDILAESRLIYSGPDNFFYLSF